MSQLGAELRRFFARRITRGGAIIAILLVLFSVTIASLQGHEGHPTTGYSTEEIGQPDGQFTTREVPYTIEAKDTRVNVGNSLGNAIEGTGIGILFLAFVLGASFVGAEFSGGSLTTQLLFEPRRWRVHLGKAGAVALGAFAISLAVSFVLAVSMFAGSEFRGIVHGTDGAWAAQRAAQALRVAVAIGAGATMAYAVTLVMRRTSAGVIVFFLQYPLLFLIDPAKMPFGVISHYEPLRGLLMVISDPAHSTAVTERAIHTMAGAAVLTALWLVVIVAGSGRLFARSEVR
jgi:hypothetical protein